MPRGNGLTAIIHTGWSPAVQVKAESRSKGTKCTFVEDPKMRVKQPENNIQEADCNKGYLYGGDGRKSKNGGIQ